MWPIFCIMEAPAAQSFSLACAEGLEESSQVLTQSVSDAGWDEAFVEEVKRYRCLCDTQCSDYKDR